MKRFFWLISSFLVSALSLSAQVLCADKGVLFSQDMSKVVSLDGNWKFLFIPVDAPCPEGYQAISYDDHNWDTIAVPGCWDALGYLDPKYVNPENVQGLYRTSFDVPKKWNGNHVFLRFDGVLRGYEVWVNGQYVGKWESAYNSCHFDVSPYIVTGRNTLAVRNYVTFKGSDFDGNDDWGQIGINRSVSLFPVQNFHVADVFVSTTNVSDEAATLNYNILLDSFAESANRQERVEVFISDPYGANIHHQEALLKPGRHSLTESILLQHPKLWTAETPSLYTLTCRIGKNEVQRITFGVREISVQKQKLLLNGRPIKLRGVNLHDTDPWTGKVISRELLLKDLSMMKVANINFIRCSHYPKQPLFYELCDSLGFYVMDEVPFGFGDSHLYDSTYQDILLTRADATVRRDKNHPSVIIWSVGNENPLTEIAEETGKHVKALDSTRPICYPMIHNYFLEKDFRLPEFIDIFAPHYPTVPTLRYYAESAERPLIATEYCHSLGQSLEQHHELWEIMEANDNLAGGAVWEWCDQGMVDSKSFLTSRYGCNEKLWLNDGTCITMNGDQGTDGIVYAERTPLSNYYEVRKNYSQAVITNQSLRATKGYNEWDINIKNRYDFLNLKDAVKFKWTIYNGHDLITEGCFILDCEPHDQAIKTLSATLAHEPADACYILEVIVVSEQWGTLAEYAIPVRSSDSRYASQLFTLAEAAEVTMPDTDLPEFWLRVGRKRGLAETIQAKKAIEHYLMAPSVVSITKGERTSMTNIQYENDGYKADGQYEYQVLENGAIRIHSIVTPAMDDKMLLECGPTLKLSSEYQYVQWLGKGPYASYPGKNSANNFGLHALKAGDLYFEGNRSGVDALLITDKSGRGYLLIAPDANICLEQTDDAVFISINGVVSGICSKLRKTAYPQYSNQEHPLNLSFTLLPIDIQSLPDWLFYDVNSIESFNPFKSQYDNYLLKTSDISNN